MYTKFILVLIALPLLVSSIPTHCDRHKESTEFRCAKNGYGADRIHIRNIVEDSFISFKINKWLSEVGKPGVKYSSSEHVLGPNESHVENFAGALGNTMSEMFIYDCKIDGNGTPCIQVVTPCVN